MKEKLRDIDIEDEAKRSCVHLIQVPEREKKKKRVHGTRSNLKKKMTENFPELMKDINLLISQVQQIPNKTNNKKSTTKNSTEASFPKDRYIESN